MRVLTVHPSRLMYSRIYLRLEPLGLELVAAAVRRAGHDVRLIDLQSEEHADYFRLIDRWQPDAVAFSGNYLANVPVFLDLARATRARAPITARLPDAVRSVAETRTFVSGAAAGSTSRTAMPSTEKVPGSLRKLRS
jgi:hypothetical protein